jgi:LytS/YehU family sensor histidine kinase
VTIRARREHDHLVISVEDDGPGVQEPVAPRPGHGLEQTRERLRVLYGERASLTLGRAAGGGAVATLRVPWRVLPPEVHDGR